MNRKFKNCFDFIKDTLRAMLILLLSSMLVYLSIPFFTSIKKALSGTDKEIVVAIIAAAATITVSIISLIIGRVIEKNKEIENTLRSNRIPVYTEFMNFTMKVLNHEIDFNNKKNNNEYLNITEKMMIWGSDYVLDAWIQFRNSASDTDSKKVLSTMEHLMFAIRNDLGHKNTYLKKDDLLSLLIKKE